MNSSTPVRRYVLPVALLLTLIATAPRLWGQSQPPAATTPKKPATVLRLWDLECGEIHSIDQSRWTPNLHVGQPVDLSDNCYVMHVPLQWRAFARWSFSVHSAAFSGFPQFW